MDEDDVLRRARERAEPLQGFLHLRIGRGAPEHFHALFGLEGAEDIFAARSGANSPHVVLGALATHDQQVAALGDGRAGDREQ